MKQTHSTELGPRESLESKLDTPHLAQSVTQPLSSDHLSRYYSENISTLPSLTPPNTESRQRDNWDGVGGCGSPHVNTYLASLRQSPAGASQPDPMKAGQVGGGVSRGVSTDRYLDSLESPAVGGRGSLSANKYLDSLRQSSATSLQPRESPSDQLCESPAELAANESNPPDTMRARIRNLLSTPETASNPTQDFADAAATDGEVGVGNA